MTFCVRLLPPARDDLIGVSNFPAEVAPNTALRAADVVDRALKWLEMFPERAPVNGLGGRDLSVPFGQAGYVIRYRIEGGNVILLRIFHSREDRSS